MSWEQAAVIVTMLGLLVGNLAKLVPFVPNILIPKIVWGVNVLGNLIIVVNKFLAAAGYPVAWWDIGRPADGVTVAGWGFLGGVLAAAGSGALAFFQLWLQRGAAAKGIRPVQSKDGEGGDL